MNPYILLLAKCWPFLLVLLFVAVLYGVAERSRNRPIDTGACGFPSPDQEFGYSDD